MKRTCAWERGVVRNKFVLPRERIEVRGRR